MNNNNFDKFNGSVLNKEQKEILEDFYFRRKLFDNYLSKHKIKLYTCPGCGYPTLTERGEYEICSVCNWEDDNQDDDEADEIWGGPNYELSLTENRLNIGKQLRDIAKNAGRKINLNPEIVLIVLSEHVKKIEELLNSIPDIAELNHPLVNNYKKEKIDLLNSLVE